MTKRRFFVHALLVLATLGFPMVAAQAPAQAADSGTWVIWNLMSGKCVDNPNGNQQNNTRIIQWTCRTPSQQNQRWTQSALFQAAYEGSYVWYYEFRNVASNKCLTVANGSRSDNAEIVQYDCVNGYNQAWATIRKRDAQYDYYWLRNYNSDKCLTVGNNVDTNGQRLVQYTCRTDTNQLWSWAPTYPF